jgi:hypothetical protein
VVTPIFIVENGTRTRVEPEWYPCERGQIKGNRNSMIYHAPGMRDYAYTFARVDCLDKAADAEKAGYRRAKR